MKHGSVSGIFVVILSAVFLSAPFIGIADNEPFIPQATQKALQDQGFITPAPLGNPFRDSDNLNQGGLFGPLTDPFGGPPDTFMPPPFPGGPGFGPDSRDMGIGSNQPNFILFNQSLSTHSD